MSSKNDKTGDSKTKKSPKAKIASKAAARRIEGMLAKQLKTLPVFGGEINNASQEDGTQDVLIDKSGKIPPDVVEVVNDIFNRIEKDQIDITYALIGYTWKDHRPIFDYDLLIFTIIEYGYNSRYALEFADAFATCFDDEAPFPILTVNEKKHVLFDCVEPIPAVQDLMKKFDS